MQLGASGNVGLFPEQAGNWDWIANQVSQCHSSLPSGRPRVLNLFAYTGGASLAAAIAGAEVTHVDSSGPTVAWAKRNAEASGLADLPIRWLVEDAMKFMERECRRGNYYDGVIADPPTYGHGPNGQPFKFKQHLGSLLELCGELLGVSVGALSDTQTQTVNPVVPVVGFFCSVATLLGLVRLKLYQQYLGCCTILVVLRLRVGLWSLSPETGGSWMRASQSDGAAPSR